MKNVLLMSLLLFLPSAYAQSQAQLARDCEAEIERVERRIADARKKPCLLYTSPSPRDS